MSLWDHNLTLKNPSMKENRWSRGVCQLIAPRCQTQPRRRAILRRPTALEVLFVLKMEGTHSRACRNQAPVQEPVLVEDSGVAKSPLVPLRGGEEHLGEDGSALTGKGKSPRTETLKSTSIKT